MSRRALAATALWAALSTISIAHACPMCAEATPPDGSARTAEAYARSIYLLMSAPFLLAGAWAGGLVLAARSRRRAEEPEP